MTISYKVRLLLVLFLAFGFCVSCGKKSSDSDAPKKPRKKREKKVEPPPVEEPQPVNEEPEVLPLPEDLSTWKMKEFIQARNEGSSKLMDACMILGDSTLRKVSADEAVAILVKVLQPVIPPETEEIPEPEITEDMDRSTANDLRREYEDKVREQEEALEKLPKLDTRKIDYIIEQISLIGSDSAWKAMLDMWQQKILTDDDSNVDQSALNAILKRPQSNNKDIVFQLLVNPESLVTVQMSEEEQEASSRRFEDENASSRSNEKERRSLEPDRVFEEALKWTRNYGDKAFRMKLAEYMTSHEMAEERTNKIMTFLMERTIGNFPCQVYLYSNDFFNEEELNSFSQYLDLISRPAFAFLTDQSMTPVEELYQTIENSSQDMGTDDSGRRRRMKKTDGSDDKADDKANDKAEDSRSSADATTENRSAGFTELDQVNDVKVNEVIPQQTMVLHPEFAFDVLRVVWSEKYIERQKSLWEANTGDDLTTIPCLAFLTSLPIKGMQQYWIDYLNERWDIGPDNYKRSPFLHTRPVNPGIVLSVKSLKRLAAPEKKGGKKNTSDRSMDKKDKLSVKEQKQQMSFDWMAFTKDLVVAQMQRMARGADYQKQTQRDVSKIKSKTPFTIPEGAEIVTEYHYLIPNTSTKKLEGMEFDPVMIHFVRIKWEAKQMEVGKKIRYKDQGALVYRNCPESKNVWFEYFKDDGSMSESLDVVINNVDTFEPSASDVLTVDIMSIQSKRSAE